MRISVKKTPGARRIRLATASAIAATSVVLLTAGPAQAHHGFDDFDTDRLYYVSGTVSEVRWGQPHSYFTVTVDSELPSDTPELELPEELQAPEDSGPIHDAPSYPGSHDSLEVTIAPPNYTGMWGLDRELEDGERVELVGYVGRTHDDEFRPVVFWYEDGRPVNQVLGSELPARPLPVPYPEEDATGTGDDDTESEEASDGTETEAVPMALWGVIGGAVLLAAIGTAVVLRSRSRRN